ncbi:hypothetical protein EIP86_006033 [Pleurotus ostreatoroseus]|nr:hypothetical protein EIP86_006033 [Pleurotus ostreatoroseus]
MRSNYAKKSMLNVSSMMETTPDMTPPTTAAILVPDLRSIDVDAGADVNAGTEFDAGAEFVAEIGAEAGENVSAEEDAAPLLTASKPAAGQVDTTTLSRSKKRPVESTFAIVKWCRVVDNPPE